MRSGREKPRELKGPGLPSRMCCARHVNFMSPTRAIQKGLQGEALIKRDSDKWSLTSIVVATAVGSSS